MTTSDIQEFPYLCADPACACHGEDDGSGDMIVTVRPAGRAWEAVITDEYTYTVDVIRATTLELLVHYVHSAYPFATSVTLAGDEESDEDVPSPEHARD